MKSSIYISSRKITVIGYTKSGKKVTVRDYVTYNLPEGAIMNGKIIDRGYIVEALHALWAKKPRLFKDSTIIVDGSSIYSKQIVLPKLSKKQCQKYIMDDFADTSDIVGDLVCDYRPVKLPHSVAGTVKDNAKKKNNNQTIWACAAEKAQVDRYMSSCKSSGITLKSVRVGLQAILDYVDSSPDLKKTTFVLNVIDGVTMLSMIFDKGINVFASRTRLFSDDYEQLIRSILENLSGIVQFNRAQNFNDIAYSYYLGLKKDDLDLMNQVNPYPNIKLETLNIFGGGKGVEKLPPEAHFAYLNILLGDNCINLMDSCQKIDRIKKSQRPKKYWIPSFIALVIALAIPIAYLYAEIYYLEEEISVIQNYLTNPSTAALSVELDQIISRTAYYSRVTARTSGAVKSEEEQNMLPVSNEFLDLVTNTHSNKVAVKKFEFTSSSRILHVDGSSATEADSAVYVESLKRNSLIEKIQYTGYSYDDDGKYNFSIDITFAIKEEPQAEEPQAEEETA